MPLLRISNKRSDGGTPFEVLLPVWRVWVVWDRWMRTLTTSTCGGLRWNPCQVFEETRPYQLRRRQPRPLQPPRRTRYNDEFRAGLRLATTTCRAPWLAAVVVVEIIATKLPALVEWVSWGSRVRAVEPIFSSNCWPTFKSNNGYSNDK